MGEEAVTLGAAMHTLMRHLASALAYVCRSSESYSFGAQGKEKPSEVGRAKVKSGNDKGGLADKVARQAIVAGLYDDDAAVVMGARVWV